MRSTNNDFVCFSISQSLNQCAVSVALRLLEDWLGAGAIIDRLSGSLSPEARAAADAFRAAQGDLQARLLSCGSGRELIERGYERDVILASELDVSTCVPRFLGRAYVNAAPG